MYAKANNNSSNNNNKDGVVQGINQSVNILLWRKLRCNSHDTNTRIKSEKVLSYAVNSNFGSFQKPQKHN